MTVCTGTPGPVPAEGAPALLVEHGLDALARADTVVVPGRARPGAPSDEVREALTAAAAGGARMISIRTGAFVLAAAGRPDAAPPPAGR